MRLPLLIAFCWFAVPLPRLCADEPPIQFNRDIRPILSDSCYTCHGPAKNARKGGLRFDTEAGAFADLGGYRALVGGKLADSHLWKRVSSADPKEKMPPAKSGKQLSARQIDLLKRWIEEGAKWQNHWAFIPPTRPSLPVVKNRDWVRNGIDAFILDRLEKEGMSASPQAARETLIRRVTLDLTGLPPTLAEIDAFLKDTSPRAYETVVDRLLTSPRYGERMVLEWLDAARYADSNGYQTDGTRAMWPWRDGVIDALNRNQPFDQFTIEQLAGDLLPLPTIAQKIASGFHRNHMLNGEGGRIAEESRVDYVVDRVNTTSSVWLGLTVACAQCHDHKYDPVSQKEYYQLYAFFNNLPESGGVDRRNGTAAPTLELPTPEQTQKIGEQTAVVTALEKTLADVTAIVQPRQAEWEKTVARDKLPPPVAAALKVETAKRSKEQVKVVGDHFLATSPEREVVKKQLDQAKQALTSLKNSVVITMIMEERLQPRESFVLLRGAYDKPGEKVGRAVPAALPPLKDEKQNRLALARWLVNGQHPLTARVMVNRTWQMFFGTGLVKTSEDFGSQGENPSHPELLDYLATEFQADWNVKALHRRIVLSATYQQSSRVTPQLLERDPDNRLLSRGPRLRLSAFALRDQALALSGLLVEKLGGPPVRPYQPPGIWEEFSFGQITYKQDKGPSLYRRSLYTFWRRSVGPPNLFDSSPRQVCTVRLARTNTPLQGLTLLNDVTYVEAARVWAEHLIRDTGSREERIIKGFRMATGRAPTPTELGIFQRAYERFLKQYQADPGAAKKLAATGEFARLSGLNTEEVAAMTAVTQMMLNLDEVITKE